MGSLWIIITAFEVISRNAPTLGETECAKLTMLNSPPPLCSNILELTIFVQSFRFNLLAHCTYIVLLRIQWEGSFQRNPTNLWAKGKGIVLNSSTNWDKLLKSWFSSGTNSKTKEQTHTFITNEFFLDLHLITNCWKFKLFSKQGILYVWSVESWTCSRNPRKFHIEGLRTVVELQEQQRQLCSDH